jgi:hypothetical protein
VTPRIPFAVADSGDSQASDPFQRGLATVVGPGATWLAHCPRRDRTNNPLTSASWDRKQPDIRFLLGDVIRAYGGEELFKRIEYIRATSVDRHRGVAGAGAIDSGLDRLSLDETLDFVRGFMLFSMLANLAEDRQGVETEKHADIAGGARAAEGATASATTP